MRDIYSKLKQCFYKKTNKEANILTFIQGWVTDA